MLCHLSSMFFN